VSENRFIPITDWNKFHPWPPIGGMRHIRFFAKERGFDTAFVKAGRRILVDEQEFFRCVRQQSEGDKAA
jgi:hypothetical protein